MTTDTQSVLELLSDRRSYPERVTRVEQVATHISWVFLTDRYAYKLKKPVRYDFLDFSTIEKRRAACLREVQLNRRLAPDIYLEVVPITKGKDGSFALGPRERAEPIDWVVRMRRLPSEESLEQLILSDRLRKTKVDELARMLTQFYSRVPPLVISVETYRRRIEEHVEGNLHELSAWAGNRSEQLIVKKLHAAQLRVLRLAPELLDNRVRDGRIVDGHGDLRPEHIYFHPHPIIIDCIEFNDEFRQLDVLDELAFLAVECTHIGAQGVGDQIIDDYQKSSQDEFSLALLDFYRTYRCCVRAKVAALRASQVDEIDRRQPDESVCSYLQMAERYAANLGPPVLLIVYGLSGSGKSTLANQLGERLGIEVLNTDSIRRELIGRSAGNAFGAGIYRPEMRTRIYEQMFARAEAMLSRGLSVILDATFYDARLRSHANELANQCSAMPLFVHCQCRPEIAVERIASRMADKDALSDATPEVYEHQRQQFDPDPPEIAACDVDTSHDLAFAVETVFAALKSALPLSSHSNIAARDCHDHAILR